jgi:hypothetical protein
LKLLMTQQRVLRKFYESLMRVFMVVILWWCHLAETSGSFLEGSSHLAESSSHLVESSRFWTGFLRVFCRFFRFLLFWMVFCEKLKTIENFEKNPKYSNLFKIFPFFYCIQLLAFKIQNYWLVFAILSAFFVKIDF